MNLGDAANTIYKNVPQDKIVPMKSKFGFPLIFLDFFFPGSDDYKILFHFSSLDEVGCSATPRSLALLL